MKTIRVKLISYQNISNQMYQLLSSKNIKLGAEFIATDGYFESDVDGYAWKTIIFDDNTLVHYDELLNCWSMLTEFQIKDIHDDDYHNCYSMLEVIDD